MERFVSYQVPDPKNGSSATFANLERDLNALIGGLALLGVKRCSQCGQFFRSPDANSFLDSGELICYGCIPDWWSSRAQEIDAVNRGRLESKLAAWLRKNHQAEVIKGPLSVHPDQCEIQLNTGCAECGGTGKLLEGERCRFCNGLGSVYVVVLKPMARAAGF
jgi:hypothetical protein